MSALRLPAFAEALQRQLGNPEFAEPQLRGSRRRARRRRVDPSRTAQAAPAPAAGQSAAPGLARGHRLAQPRRGLDKALVQSLGHLRAGSPSTATCSSSGPTGIGKSWLAWPSPSARAAPGTRPTASAPRGSSTSSPSPAATAPTRGCSRAWPRPTCWSSTTWGWRRSQDQERRDLLEILEDRSERASTLITSQVPVKAWHELIGEPTIADAICDRLIHTAYIIELQGPSLREPKAKARRSTKGGA